MKIHEKYIKRCIELARNGLGSTYPNPMVGSVIVHEEQIIGEGWHHRAGEAHAEVNAINSVSNEKLLKDATIYVSLEPCSHYGKTPPCSDLIIAKGIKRVVIGTMDPFAEVAGRGIKKLMEAGCEVNVGILETECQDLNKRFFTYHNQKRPYIILKWAQSLDGYIAPETKIEKRPVWITNKYSGQLVHKWRTEEAAILVGTSTALADNPRLNVRNWTGNNPVRILIDKDLKVPVDSAIFSGNQRTVVLTATAAEKDYPENVVLEQLSFSDNIAAAICEVLYKHEIQSVIIEGGSRTLQQFIDSGLWDEATVFTGNLRMHSGIAAPRFSGERICKTAIQEDILEIFTNQQTKL